MTSILSSNRVLVLNRNWQAIDITTPADAFCRLATGSVQALDIAGTSHMLPVLWEDWLRLPVRDDDESVQTVSGPVRVPTVLVLRSYAKVPMRQPSFSLRAVRARDGGRCQYTGRQLAPGEGNIDHVIPQSRGGPTSWTNCVLSCAKVNSKKAAQTPGEAGLRLVRPPKAPPVLPVTQTLQNPLGIADWAFFLKR